MNMVAKVATGVAVPLIAIGIVVEGLGKGLGDTWNGPQYLAARLNLAANVEKLTEIGGHREVMQFVKDPRHNPLIIVVNKEGKITHINRIDCALAEGSVQQRTAVEETEEPEKKAVEMLFTEDDKPKSEEEDAAPAPVASVLLPDGSKEYSGWSAVWEWVQINKKNIEA